MSVNAIFNTAQTGLNAQKIAIEVTSENIANVNTPGYSRQRAILETAPTTTYNGFPLGSGVKVTAIQRSYDDYLQTLLKNENSTLGYNSTLYTSMQRIEQLFNEFTTDGIGTMTQEFFTSWQDLAMNPQGMPERQMVIDKAQFLIDSLHRVNSYLTDVKTQADRGIPGVLEETNSKLQQIAALNAQIQQAESLSANANELRDQRELLVREIAGKVGINYTEETDGTLTIRLATGGQTLVDHYKYATMYANHNGTNNDVMLTPTGNPPPGKAPLADTNVTATVGGPANSQGEIGGLLQVRNTTVDKYLGQLDEFAFNLVNVMNGVHATGYGLDGVTGRNFFTPLAVTAGASASISLAVGSPAQLAAADADPTVNGTGNNKTALQISALKTQTIATSLGNMSLEAFYNSIVSGVGVGAQGAERAAELSETVLQQLNNLRESQSGVSLDEELANLIKYQKAFEGSAKLINTATEMLDTVLNLVR